MPVCIEGKHHECAGREKLAYAYRPVLLASCNDIDACARLGQAPALQLPGYGVEMAIKNMEYSAMDDAKVSCLMIYCQHKMTFDTRVCW